MNKKRLYGDRSINCFILYRFIYISLDASLWLNFDKIKCLCRLPARSPLRPPRTQAWGEPDSHVLYGSKEEKARQDVIARRARRRLQSTAARDNTRFKIYTTSRVKNKRHPASQEICPQSLDYLDVLAKSRNFGSCFAQVRKVWWLDEAGDQKPPDLVLVSTSHDFVDFLSGFTSRLAIAQCSTPSRGIKICQPEELLVWSLSNISAAVVGCDVFAFPRQLGLSCAIQLDKIKYGKTELFHS
jgi:hypothetical protein